MATFYHWLMSPQSPPDSTPAVDTDTMADTLAVISDLFQVSTVVAVITTVTAAGEARWSIRSLPQIPVTVRYLKGFCCNPGAIREAVADPTPEGCQTVLARSGAFLLARQAPERRPLGSVSRSPAIGAS